MLTRQPSHTSKQAQVQCLSLLSPTDSPLCTDCVFSLPQPPYTVCFASLPPLLSCVPPPYTVPHPSLSSAPISPCAFTPRPIPQCVPCLSSPPLPTPQHVPFLPALCALHPAPPRIVSLPSLPLPAVCVLLSRPFPVMCAFPSRPPSPTVRPLSIPPPHPVHSLPPLRPNISRFSSPPPLSPCRPGTMPSYYLGNLLGSHDPGKILPAVIFRRVAPLLAFLLPCVPYPPPLPTAPPTLSCIPVSSSSKSSTSTSSVSSESPSEREKEEEDASSPASGRPSPRSCTDS